MIVLKRKPAEVVGIIKFRVLSAHEKIRKGIEAFIETSRGLMT
jgi:hypothetical protein